MSALGWAGVVEQRVDGELSLGIQWEGSSLLGAGLGRRSRGKGWNREEPGKAPGVCLDHAL